MFHLNPAVLFSVLLLVTHQVFAEVPDVRSSSNFPYVLSSVIGVLLCGIPPTIWLC